MTYCPAFQRGALTKEEYLEQILPLIPELQGHFATVEENLSKLSSEKCTEKTFLQGTGSAMKHIDRISSKIGGLRPAPFECIEYGQYPPSVCQSPCEHSPVVFEYWLAKPRCRAKASAVFAEFEGWHANLFRNFCTK